MITNTFSNTSTNNNINKEIKNLVQANDTVFKTKVSADNFKEKVVSNFSFKKDSSNVKIENTRVSTIDIKSLDFDNLKEKPTITTNTNLKNDVKELFSKNEQNFSTKVKAVNFATKVIETSNSEDKSSSTNKPQKNEKSNTDNFYSNKLDEAKDKLASLIDKKSDVPKSNQINTEYIYIVSDAVTAIEQKKIFSADKLKEINNLLGNLTEGKPLTKDDLVKLKTFASFIASNSGSLGMDKTKFNELINLTEGCLKAQELVDTKTKEVSNKTEQIDQKLKILLTEMAKPDAHVDSNVIEMLQVLSQRYSRVKDSGNPVSIALFSNYLDKVMSTMQQVKAGKAEGSFVFQNLQKEYDTFTDNLFKNLGQGKLSEAEIRQYLGDKADDVISLLKSKLRIPSGKPAAEGGASGGGGTPSVTPFEVTPEAQSVINDMKDTLTFSDTERKTMSSVSNQSMAKAMSNPKISNMISDIRHDVKDLNRLVHELKESTEQLNDSFSKLTDFIQKNSIVSLIQKLQSKTEKSDYIINKEIAELIAKADEAFAKLDLSVDSKDANPADLLKKFREIIIKLDKELRALKDHTDQMKIIDENNLRRIKENNDRQKLLNQERDKNLSQIKKDFALKTAKV